MGFPRAKIQVFL